MNTSRIVQSMLAIAVALVICAGAARADDVIPYTDTFYMEDCKLGPRGVNDYFIPLKPYQYLLLEGEDDNGEGGTETVTVYIKVLPQIRTVSGVRCAVVRESEWIDGELVEISDNYFAYCSEHQCIYYFGEDVDIYEDDVVVSHDGAWLAGQNGAKPGMNMPGKPLIGCRYVQETAEGVAMDRAEHLDNETVVYTPMGAFGMCLYTVESSPLEPGHLSFKAYAKNVGMVMDSAVRLIDYGNSRKDYEPAESE